MLLCSHRWGRSLLIPDFWSLKIQVQKPQQIRKQAVSVNLLRKLQEVIKWLKIANQISIFLHFFHRKCKTLEFFSSLLSRVTPWSKTWSEINFLLVEWTNYSDTNLFDRFPAIHCKKNFTIRNSENCKKWVAKIFFFRSCFSIRLGPLVFLGQAPDAFNS